VWRNMVYKTMKRRLEAMNHHRPPYSTRFPTLGQIDEYLAGDKGVPPGNLRVARNLSVGGKWLHVYWHAKPEMIDARDNVVVKAPGEAGFVAPADPASRRFDVRDDSPACKRGFRRIPVGRIGPRPAPAGSNRGKPTTGR